MCRALIWGCCALLACRGCGASDLFERFGVPFLLLLHVPCRMGRMGGKGFDFFISRHISCWSPLYAQQHTAEECTKSVCLSYGRYYTWPLECASVPKQKTKNGDVTLSTACGARKKISDDRDKGCWISLDVVIGRGLCRTSSGLDAWLCAFSLVCDIMWVGLMSSIAALAHPQTMTLNCNNMKLGSR